MSVSLKLAGGSLVFIVMRGDQKSLESWVQAVYSGKEEADRFANSELMKKRWQLDSPWVMVEEHAVDSEEA